MTNNLHLQSRHRQLIEKLADQHVPDIEMWAYGSRVNGQSHDGSDLDLVLRGPDLAETPTLQLAEFEEALNDSTLPFLVDVHDWARLPQSFHRQIERQYVVVRRPTNSNAEPNVIYSPAFPAHWNRRPLYSVARWVNGLAFRDIEFSAKGRPIIKIAEIKNGISTQTKFTQQQFDDSVCVREGDLLFAWSGQPETSIDAFWWRGPLGWLNQHIFRVTPSAKMDATFFFYVLRYLKRNFVSIARDKQTTGLGHVTKQDLRKIQVAYPDLPEQRAIAGTLGVLDRKIELNRQMAATLNTSIKVLFESLFDPAHHPDWPRRFMADVASMVRGRSYSSLELTDSSDTAMVTLKSFGRRGGYRSEGLKAFRGSYNAEQVVSPGEVVVACTDMTQAAEVVGRAAIVQPSRKFTTLVASLDVLVLRPANANISAAFVYGLTSTRRFISHAKAHATGTTVLHLDRRAVPQFQFAYPPRELVAAFDRIAGPALERCSKVVHEAECLQELRDALLPRLMSGEIGLRDAEAAFEAVT